MCPHRLLSISGVMALQVPFGMQEEMEAATDVVELHLGVHGSNGQCINPSLLDLERAVR